jgi:hypothetical protein
MFHAEWDSVFRSVQWVQYGLAHRDMSGITAIGVDEVSYTKGHNYMTLGAWCTSTMRSRLPLLKKFVKTLRNHEELLMNYFQAKNNTTPAWWKGLTSR